MLPCKAPADPARTFCQIAASWSRHSRGRLVGKRFHAERQAKRLFGLSATRSRESRHGQRLAVVDIRRYSGRDGGWVVAQRLHPWLHRFQRRQKIAGGCRLTTPCSSVPLPTPHSHVSHRLPKSTRIFRTLRARCLIFCTHYSKGTYVCRVCRPLSSRPSRSLHPISSFSTSP